MLSQHIQTLLNLKHRHYNHLCDDAEEFKRRQVTGGTHVDHGRSMKWKRLFSWFDQKKDVEDLDTLLEKSAKEDQKYGTVRWPQDGRRK
jgi:hypothetical protein